MGRYGMLRTNKYAVYQGMQEKSGMLWDVKKP